MSELDSTIKSIPYLDKTRKCGRIALAKLAQFSPRETAQLLTGTETGVRGCKVAGKNLAPAIDASYCLSNE